MYQMFNHDVMLSVAEFYRHVWLHNESDKQNISVGLLSVAKLDKTCLLTYGKGTQSYQSVKLILQYLGYLTVGTRFTRGAADFM